MSVIVRGPVARRALPPALREMLGQGIRGAPASTPRYEWGVEIRSGVAGGREFFYLLLTPGYSPRRPRARRWIVPGVEVEALARMILAGASLRRVVEAPLTYWGALPRWLRRELAREVLPIIALFVGPGPARASRG